VMHLGEEDEFISNTAQAEIKSGARKQAERNRLQLSRSAPCLLPPQWRALQRRSGSAREQANNRISTSASAVTFGRSNRSGGGSALVSVRPALSVTR
jgi:hypothetical protein